MNTANLASPMPAKAPRLPHLEAKNQGKAQARQPQIGSKTSPLLDKSQPKALPTTEKADTAPPKTQLSKELQEYFRVIDRLEQNLTAKNISTEELDTAIDGLQEKLTGLSPDQKKKLLGMEFFVKNKIENLKALKVALTEALQDEAKRTEALDLLKDKQFISLINNLEGSQGKASTYDNLAKSSAAKPLPSTAIKA